jgi:hypothetical protein
MGAIALEPMPDESVDVAEEGYGALRLLDEDEQWTGDFATDFERLRAGLTELRKERQWILHNVREIKHEPDRYGRDVVRLYFRLVNEEYMWTSGFSFREALDTALTYQRTAQRLAYRLDGAA